MVLFFSACSKKSDPTPEELLTGGSSKAWKYSSVKVNGQSYTLSAEDLATRFTYNSNGTLFLFDGTETYTGYWKFQDNYKTLVDAGNATFTADETYNQVKELSASKLHLFRIDSTESVETIYVPAN